MGPGEIHLRILKWFWRYIYGTKDLGMVLGGYNNGNTLYGHVNVYVNAIFTNDLYNRYSTAGHIAFIGKSPIYWKSTL